MPLVRNQAAATHGCSSGLTNELPEHPRGLKSNKAQWMPDRNGKPTAEALRQALCDSRVLALCRTCSV